MIINLLLEIFWCYAHRCYSYGDQLRVTRLVSSAQDGCFPRQAQADGTHYAGLSGAIGSDNHVQFGSGENLRVIVCANNREDQHYNSSRFNSRLKSKNLLWKLNRDILKYKEWISHRKLRMVMRRIEPSMKPPAWPFVLLDGAASRLEGWELVNPWLIRFFFCGRSISAPVNTAG